MGLAFVPLYIKYLGIEAYGLIGLFSMLQAWLSLLDMGMTPTLGREMARFTGGTHSAQSIRDLLRSIEFITFGIALLIAGGIALGSNWIATHWLQAEALPVEVVTQAFTVMGVVTALRFTETIYRSSIIGLQRQVLYSTVNSTMATMRGLGAIAILAWVSLTIQAFFLWQAFISIATLTILAAITYATLPRTERGGRFSLEALRGVWRFAGGMIGIAFLALLLTQVDKILLSKLLSLSVNMVTTPWLQPSPPRSTCLFRLLLRLGIHACANCTPATTSPHWQRPTTKVRNWSASSLAAPPSS